ncbi:MAG: DUF58 domain-containing protein [Bacteroidales bacterium]|nr:DUF58 domain-containing protein [Bacteroidales bacterium]MCF8337633.1 DUF58 domain-containing protein [Bacteroidales bacterium]
MSEGIDKERLQQFHSLEFLAKQVVEGFITGLHKSPFHGFSVEFAEHRLYNQGESTRHIDWKLYAKTERLYVKRYEEETNLRCQVVIDNSSSMYFPLQKAPNIDNPNKITFSVYAAAAILQLLKKQRDAAGLSVFSDKIELSTKARSSNTHHQYLFTELEKYLQPIEKDERRTTSAVDSLHMIAEQIHKRSLVIVFSDMLENTDDPDKIFSALQHLKHNKHEVILFHVHDQAKEIDFDYKQRPYRFIDMETGEKIKLLPDEVRAAYRDRLKSFKDNLKLKCGQYKIDFVEADINRGFEQILRPLLLKRNKMF